MSVFSLKIDIADNKFFNGETSPLFSQSQAKLARQFHQKIAGYRPTPLCALDDLANLFGVKKILVKDESKRFGLNAFKMLGGAYAIAQLLCEKYHLDIETLSFEHLKNTIGEKMTFATTTDGNLRLYALCPWNTREWDSMEFGIIGDRIVYRGVGDELPAVPVAAGVTVDLDFANGKTRLQVPITAPGDVPTTGPVYMLASGYGSMNWGASEDVIGLNKIWSDKGMWLAVRYFEAGTRVRFSTDGTMFGKGEFISLDTNYGFTQEDGYAIVQETGTYGIYVNLNKRIVAIQPATIYTYGTASSSTSDANVNSPFVASEDGKTLSYTVENEGQLRFHPDIEAFGSDVSHWKREYYVDLTSLDILQRLEGSDEPNKDHVWQPGTVITLDFRTMKATITE